MKKVYLVRHGETEYNLAQLVQDGNTVLTEKGKRQAEMVAERVKHLSFDNFLVSDYVRTKQTAEPLEKLLNKKAEYTELLREVRRPSSFWHKNNRSREFTEFRNLATENYHNKDWHHSDEENFYDVKDRVEKIFSKLNGSDEDTVIISHGHFIRYMVMYVIAGCNLTPAIWRVTEHGFQAYNTGITTIIYDEEYKQWKLLTFNDIAHFAE